MDFLLLAGDFDPTEDACDSADCLLPLAARPAGAWFPFPFGDGGVAPMPAFPDEARFVLWFELRFLLFSPLPSSFASFHSISAASESFRPRPASLSALLPTESRRARFWPRGELSSPFTSSETSERRRFPLAADDLLGFSSDIFFASEYGSNLRFLAF